MAQSVGRVKGDVSAILPMGRKLLIEPTLHIQYKGKIIIPDNCQQMAPTTGAIRVLGFDLQDDEANRLRAGDVVAYSRYAGVELRLDNGKAFLVIDADDVLAILRGNVEGIDNVPVEAVA